MSTTLEITHATLLDDGRRMRLELELHNPSARTLHLVRTLRALRYDPDSRTLEVQLSDRGLEEVSRVDNFIWPRFTSIDPSGTLRFGITLPRVISRVKPGQANVRTPIIESLSAHEAREVEVEIAWSRTPFYEDPRPSVPGPRAMLVAWAQGHARVRLRRDADDGPTGPSSDPSTNAGNPAQHEPGAGSD